MSDYHCKVVRLTDVKPHPNADSLSLGDAGGYPVIFKTGTWNEGDLVSYIPVDSIVPDTPDWAWLGGNRRIKAKRLRGIFSMGLITDAPPGLSEGDDVSDALNIQKYVPSIELNMTTENERDPGFLPVYTDIESFRRQRQELLPSGFIREQYLRESGYPATRLVESPGAIGEEVIITEKVHGANARFVYRDDRIWVGSHHQIKRFDMTNMWWRVVQEKGLEHTLSLVPNIAFYGEVYGQVQDLKYGREGLDVVFFDAMDTTTFRYLDYDEFTELADRLNIPVVPTLYRGPWSYDLLSLAEGKTVIGDGKHVREGIVIRPVKERRAHFGRVILKMVGEGYHLRK